MTSHCWLNCNATLACNWGYQFSRRNKTSALKERKLSFQRSITCEIFNIRNLVILLHIPSASQHYAEESGLQEMEVSIVKFASYTFNELHNNYLYNMKLKKINS